MQSQKYKNLLIDNIDEFHKILAKQGRDIYEQYKNNPQEAARLFLQSVCLPRSVFKRYLESKSMNTSSVGGAMLEWTIYHMINSMLEFESIECVGVDNKYTIPFKWKKKGHPKLNIDIAVGFKGLKASKFKRLLYLVEVKTNFEDGFLAYFDQQRIIVNHRRKIQPDFRYHYLAFSNPLKNMPKRKISAVKGKNQLWVFALLGDKDMDVSEKLVSDYLPKAESFLSCIYDPIISFVEKAGLEAKRRSKRMRKGGRYIELFESDQKNGDGQDVCKDRIYEGEDGKLHYQKNKDDEDDEYLAEFKLEDISKHFNNGYTYTSAI